MKTAVSIPNDIFQGAERLARKTRRSRSRFFSDALREYLARHSPDKITEAMDQALADIGKVQGEELEDRKDSFRAAAARRTLKQTEW